ncbi:MAG: YncE family protein, partial [Nitrososphaeraceae archaeon]
MTFLMVLVLVFVTIFSSNNVFAQTLHNRTLYEIVKLDSQLYENPQIEVGIEPKDIEIHERTNKVYVANRGSDSVSVISGDSNTKIKDIPVGNRPVAIGINNFGDKVYVANFNSANISVISTATDTKLKDIPVGDNPSDISIDEYKNRIYVVNQGSDSISVIENDTNIDKDILVEHNPYAIGIVRDNSFTTNLYITNPDSDSITVINADNYSKIKDIPVGERPMAISTNEFANRDLIFVANAFSDNITIIDGTTNTKIENISVGKMPMDIDIVRPTFFTAKIFVANSASNNISVIDENGMTEYIPVGNSPSAIGINERTNSVYVSNLFSNGVSVIDGVNNTLVARILVNVNPFNAGFIECDELKTPTNQYVYVWSGAECIAKQNKGFEFQSWEENLNNNSTLIIKGSSDTSNTIFDFIANSLDSIVNFFGLKSSLDSIVNFFGLKSSLDSI